MKKVYEKPEIMFESFASSTNIAGDCLKIIDTFSYGLCGFVYDDEHTVFTTDFPDACTTTNGEVDGDEDDNLFDFVCYHNPENTRLFNS